MGQILVHEFITLDGVFEAPRWTMEYGFDPKMGEAIGGIMGPCKAILLGRQTFEEFAPAWSRRTADAGSGRSVHERVAEVRRVGNAPERRLEQLDDPRTVQRGCDPLAQGSGRRWHLCERSGTLVRAMLADGVVDELHLFVYPVALGAGARLFADSQVKFTLAQTHSYDNGVLHLAYRPAVT